MRRNVVFFNVNLSQCEDVCDPKPNFIYLNLLKTHCSRPLRFYFAHVIEGTLKGTNRMFMLHSHFKMNEYFIQMNNKYAFFLPDNVSTLFFSATNAFSVCASLSLSVSYSLSHFSTDGCFFCSGMLNYLVVKHQSMW